MRTSTAVHAPHEAPWRLTFSGSGAEYFRLWIANLLLTVVTLGIYSAWAKVRRMQYFARNTQLAGASFDFRGSAWVVLRGRLLALVLLLGYRVTFGMAALAWILAFLAAVARLHNASSLGKISFLTIGTLLFTTMIAALVGIGLTNLFGLTADGLVAGAAEISRLHVIQSD